VIEIRSQLELSTRYLRLALDNVNDPAQATSLAWEAYVQLRAAHAKVLNGLGGKYPNPLYQQASTLLQSARDHLLQGRSALGNPGRVSEGTAVQVAINRFGETLRLIELALLTSF
jgi:hypothetical protein